MKEETASRIADILEAQLVENRESSAYVRMRDQEVREQNQKAREYAAKRDARVEEEAHKRHEAAMAQNRKLAEEQNEMARLSAAEQTELLTILRKWQAFVASGNGQRPYACPVCFGRRVVPSPWPMAAEGVVTTGGTVPCAACEGAGVLWR